MISQFPTIVETNKQEHPALKRQLNYTQSQLRTAIRKETTKAIAIATHNSFYRGRDNAKRR